MWIARRLKFQLACVRHHGSRVACVIGSSPVLKRRLIFVSAHAPHEGSPDCAKDDFWEDLRSHVAGLRAAYPQHEFVVALDANARVQSSSSFAIGAFGGDRDSSNGTRFRVFLEASGLHAIDTQFDAGWTWKSTFGTVSKIDYVCADATWAAFAQSAEACDDVPLQFGPDEDHRPLAVFFSLPPGDCGKVVKKKGIISFNKFNLRFSEMREHFQAELSKFNPGPDTTMSLDEHVHEWSAWVRRSAKTAFGSPKDQPRQPWISADTWEVVQWTAPMLRFRHAVQDARKQTMLGVAFWAIAAASAEEFPPTGTRLKGWAALCRMQGFVSLFKFADRLQLSATRVLRAIKRASRPLVAIDREAWIEAKAEEADTAATTGDHRTVNMVTRLLSGKALKKEAVAVKDKDGNPTATVEDRQSAWEQPFSEVFGGCIVDHAEYVEEFLHTLPESELAITRNIVARALNALKANKGVAGDGIPGELLQAGGEIMVEHLLLIFCASPSSDAGLWSGWEVF